MSHGTREHISIVPAQQLFLIYVRTQYNNFSHILFMYSFSISWHLCIHSVKLTQRIKHGVNSSRNILALFSTSHYTFLLQQVSQLFPSHSNIVSGGLWFSYTINKLQWVKCHSPPPKVSLVNPPAVTLLWSSLSLHKLMEWKEKIKKKDFFFSYDWSFL